MPYSILTKDGIRINNIPDDVPKDAEELKERVAKAREERQYQEELKQTETAGTIESLIGSTKKYVSSMGTALDVGDTAEEAALQGIERQQDIAKDYRPGIDISRIGKRYEKEGLFSAAKETLSQVLPATAEQVPILTSMGVGAAAGSPFGPLGMLAGSLIAPFLSYVGSNMERRASEQLAKGEEVDISRGKAALTAVGQSAAERLSLGMSGLSRAIGINVLGREVAKDAVKDSMSMAITKGVGRYALAEVPTEIAQQAMERAYAGLDVTGEEAMKEYGEVAAATLLSSPLGAFSGYKGESLNRKEINSRELEEKANLAAIRENAERVKREEIKKQTTEKTIYSLQESINDTMEVSTKGLEYFIETSDIKKQIKPFEDRLEVLKEKADNAAADMNARAVKDYQTQMLKISANITEKINKFKDLKLEDIQKQTNRAIKGREFIANEIQAAKDLKAEVDMQTKTPGIATDTLLRNFIGLQRRSKTYKELLGKDLKNPEVFQSMVNIFNEYEPNIRQGNYGIFLTNLTDYMEKNYGQEITSIYAGERDVILNRSKLQPTEGNKAVNRRGTTGDTGDVRKIDDGKREGNLTLEQESKTLLDALDKRKTAQETETNPDFIEDAKDDEVFLTKMLDRFSSKTLKKLPKNLGKTNERRLAGIVAEWVGETKNNPEALQDPDTLKQYNAAVKLIQTYEPNLAKGMKLSEITLKEQPATQKEQLATTQELIHEPYSETTNLSEFEDLKNPDLKSVEELLAEVDILYEQLEAARDKIKGQKRPRAKNLQAINKIEGEMTDSAMRWRVGQRTGDPYNITPTKLGTLFNSFLFAPSKYSRDNLQNHINELKKRSGPSTDEYQEFNSLPADPELIRTVTLGNKTLPQAVNTVLRAKKDLNPYEKYILQKIAATPNIGNVRVKEGVQRDVGKAYRGSFSSLTNTIGLEPNAANIITIMHEGVHAATVREISKHLTKNDKVINNSVLGQDLLNMFNTAKEADIDNEYSAAFQNVREFVAYGLTDQDFQKFLANTRSVNVVESRISNMWNDFVNFVKKLLKMDDISNTVLNDLLTVTPDLFQGPNPTLVGPTAGTETYYQEAAPTNPLDPPKRNSTGFFQGMMNQITTPHIPESSVAGKFLKARVKLANFGGALQERLQDEAGDMVFLGDQARADILLDQALHATAIAGQAAETGFVSFNRFGFAEVTPDDNNMSSIFNTIAQLAKTYGEQEAQDMTHRFLVANRFLGEEAANRERQRMADDAIDQAEYLLKNQKIERDAKRRAKALKRKARALEKDITKITPEQLAASEEVINQLGNIEELQQIKAINYKMNIQHINVLEEAGVYSQAQADKYRNTAEWYVPVFRALDENDPATKEYFRGFADLGREFEFKGSEKQVSNVLENMLKKHFWSVNAAIRNHANIKAAKAVALTDENDELVTYRRLASVPKDKQDKATSVYIDGEQVWVIHEDPYFAMAIEGSEVPIDDMGKYASFFSKTFRLGITANPIFQAYQVFNDAISSALFSGVKNPFRLALRVLNSYKEASLNPDDPILKRMAQFGIVGGFYGYDNRDITKDLRIRYKMQDDTLVNKMLRGTDKFAANSDVAQRRALFEQTLLETGGVRQADGNIIGGNEVLAINRAMNIINWQRRGQSGTIRWLAHLVPFLNAYIQGMDVVVQSIRGRNIAGVEKAKAFNLFMGTAFKLMAMNLLYTMAMNGSDDEDEYESIDDRQKLRNYFIPGTDFKLPIRAELALLTKVIPELTYNIVVREGTENEYDATKIKKALWNSITDAALGPNLLPQIIRPAAEVTLNYDFFRDRPIVGLGYQKLDSELQYNEYTSELAKILGEFGVSPLKTDHFIKGTFGTMGSMALYILDGVANQLFDLKRPATPVDRIPIVSPILRSKEGQDFINDFYDLLETSQSLTTNVNKLVALGDVEGAMKKIEDNEKLYMMKDTINSINNQISKLRDYRKMIVSSDMTSGEKQKELEDVRKMTNELLRNIAQVRLLSGL